jgi:hypothetical protein
MKGGGEMKLPRKLKDGKEYTIEAAGCNVTFALYGWEGREEEIKDKFAKALVDAAIRQIERGEVA